MSTNQFELLYRNEQAEIFICSTTRLTAELVPPEGVPVAEGKPLARSAGFIESFAIPTVVGMAPKDTSTKSAVRRYFSIGALRTKVSHT